MYYFNKLLEWKTILEILILWLIIYRMFLFLKGTKAVYLLRGIIIVIIFFFVFQNFGLFVLSWLLTKLFAVFLLLIVIVFQPEFREGLIRLGKRHIFYMEPKKEEIENALRTIVAAAAYFSRKKIGALVAIKREIGLQSFIESGVALNAELSAELLESLFFPLNPLHDGGVIVEGNKIVAASCLFPNSDNSDFEKIVGMRHRAGVGLSEHSDAVVLIVSEENGNMSLAINGQLTGGLNSDDLLTILRGQFAKKT